jgi:hypothetical protein
MTAPNVNAIPTMARTELEYPSQVETICIERNTF